jgi:hypothetical protein
LTASIGSGEIAAASLSLIHVDLHWGAAFLLLASGPWWALRNRLPSFPPISIPILELASLTCNARI